MPDNTLDDPSPRAVLPRADPLQVVWVIAWRHIKESLHNRSTYLMAGFYLLLPLGLVLFTLRPVILAATTAASRQEAGILMALYLLMAGLLPSTWSVGIASGAFAAEKEQGSLVPLLATPASNATIFGGKVLGAVLPALTMAAVGVFGYLAEIALLFGIGRLSLLPAAFSLLVLALLPAMSLLGAGLSSTISARVKTEQVANQYGSLILTFIWIFLFFAVLRTSAWGLGAFATYVAVIYVLALVLIRVSAATWRREEVMAQR